MCNLEFFSFCSRVQFWCHIWTWKEMQSSAKTGLPDGGKFPCTNTPPLSKKYIQWSQSTLDKSIFLPMQFHETLGCVLFILVIWSHARPIKKTLQNSDSCKTLYAPVTIKGTGELHWGYYSTHQDLTCMVFLWFRSPTAEQLTCWKSRIPPFHGILTEGSCPFCVKY